MDKERRKRPWTAPKVELTLWMLFLAGLVVAALIVGSENDNGDGNGDSGAEAAEGDASAELACSHMRNVARDWFDGILTDSELREKIKEVHGSASSSEEPGIASGAREMLAAATALDVDRLTDAVVSF